jgi:hypothetical protein
VRWRLSRRDTGTLSVMTTVGDVVGVERSGTNDGPAEATSVTTSQRSWEQDAVARAADGHAGVRWARGLAVAVVLASVFWAGLFLLLRWVW